MMAPAEASGPSGGQPSDDDGDYPGRRLGLPESGPRSIAGLGRRLLALLIDWLIAYGIGGLGLSLGLISYPWLATAVLIIWFVIGVLAVRLFAFTPGQLVCGLVAVRIGDQGELSRPGVGRATGRGLLIALLIPPLVIDPDGRGLHDRLTGTVVLRR